MTQTITDGTQRPIAIESAKWAHMRQKQTAPRKCVIYETSVFFSSSEKAANPASLPQPGGNRRPRQIPEPHGACYLTFRVFFFFLIYLFIWLCWVFVAACRLSLVAASGGYSSLWCMGFSLQWLLLLQNTGSRRVGFSSCGTWAQ